MTMLSFPDPLDRKNPVNHRAEAVTRQSVRVEFVRRILLPRVEVKTTLSSDEIYTRRLEIYTPTI